MHGLKSHLNDDIKCTFVENSISNIPNVTRIESLRNDGMAKTRLTSSGYLLQRLLGCLKLALDTADLLCKYQRKNLFLWAMTARQTRENQRWMNIDLMLLIRGICINFNLNPVTKFSGTDNRSTYIKYTFPWNIYDMIKKSIPIRIIIKSCEMKRSIPLWANRKVNGNWYQLSKYSEQRIRILHRTKNSVRS